MYWSAYGKTSSAFVLINIPESWRTNNLQSISNNNIWISGILLRESIDDLLPPSLGTSDAESAFASQRRYVVSSKLIVYNTAWHSPILATWETDVHLYIVDCSSNLYNYNDVIMGAMSSQITSLRIVYSSVYSGAHQRKPQSSASLAFVWGIHRWPVSSPHKGPVTRKMMTSSWLSLVIGSFIWKLCYYWLRDWIRSLCLYRPLGHIVILAYCGLTMPYGIITILQLLFA